MVKVKKWDMKTGNKKEEIYKIMKQYLPIFLAAALFSFVSCSRENPENYADRTILTLKVYSAENSVKSSVVDGGTTVYWEPSDAIKVFYGSDGARFTSTNTDASPIADFTGSLNIIFGSNEGVGGGKELWAVYPFRADATSDGKSITTTLPSKQVGRAGSFARNMNITMARSNSFNLGFYNVCGGLRFSLVNDNIKKVVFEGRNNEDIAGQVKIAFDDSYPLVSEVKSGEKSITLTAPDGKTFEPDKWYYIVALPGQLENGFKLTFYTDTQCAELEHSESVTVSRGTFGSIEKADEGLSFQDSGEDPEQPETKDGPFFSEGVELACLIWNLAGAPEYNECHISQVNQSIDEYFAPVKNHRAVQLAREYYQQNICYDAVTAFGLHLLISDDGYITFNPKYSEDNPNDGFSYRWTTYQREEMLDAMNDFYQVSGYHEWFLSLKPLFDEAVVAFNKVCDVDYQWYKEFFGTIEKSSNQIILSFLIGNNNNGLSVLLPDGTIMSSPVMGCALQNQAGEIWYGDILDIIIHEFCHPYCNPLISKYWNSMEEYAEKVYRKVSRQMESQAYGSSQTMMCETFVRASVIRYMLSHRRNYDKEYFIRQEENLGFLLVRTFVDVLEKRESNYSLYPTMDEFMPELVKAMQEYEPVTYSGKYDEYDNPETPNLLPGVFSVGPNKKVQFTKSNLFWNGNNWRFESNQMNFPVEWNPSHVGHFYWTATAQDSYAESYPFGKTTQNDHLFCDGSDINHTLTVEGIEGLRVLDDNANGELTYLIEKRNNAHNLYKFPVTIKGVGQCVVFAPDGYSGHIEEQYDSTSWQKAEADGLVCFSPNGLRFENRVEDVNGYHGMYYSGTNVDESVATDCAHGLFFSNWLYHNPSYTSRCNGCSIRLVKDID